MPRWHIFGGARCSNELYVRAMSRRLLLSREERCADTVPLPWRVRLSWPRGGDVMHSNDDANGIRDTVAYAHGVENPITLTHALAAPFLVPLAP